MGTYDYGGVFAGGAAISFGLIVFTHYTSFVTFGNLLDTSLVLSFFFSVEYLWDTILFYFVFSVEEPSLFFFLNYEGDRYDESANELASL